YLLLIASLLWLPGNPLLWLLGVVGLSFGPLAPALLFDRDHRLEHLGRGLLALAFLAFEASLIADAIVRVIVRISITRKHLLQWTSAAHTELGIEAKSPRAMFWRLMVASPL